MTVGNVMRGLGKVRCCGGAGRVDDFALPWQDERAHADAYARDFAEFRPKQKKKSVGPSAAVSRPLTTRPHHAAPLPTLAT